MDARAGPLSARRSPLRFCARMQYALEVKPWSIPQPRLSCRGRRRMLGRLRCPLGYVVIHLISVASAVAMNQSALRLPFPLTVKHVVREGPDGRVPRAQESLLASSTAQHPSLTGVHLSRLIFRQSAHALPDSVPAQGVVLPGHGGSELALRTTNMCISQRGSMKRGFCAHGLALLCLVHNSGRDISFLSSQEERGRRRAGS